MDNDIFNDITEGLNEFISHKKSGTLIEKETIEVAVPDVKEIGFIPTKVQNPPQDQDLDLLSDTHNRLSAGFKMPC